MENAIAQSNIREEKKYTVREVLDSLSYSLLDHDDDEDGFIHIASNLNGMEVKLKKSDL